MSASPRTATSAGAGRFPVASRSGTDRMVFTFAVTSSPRAPSPRVDARASAPRSYTSSSDSPSNFGSIVYATRPRTSRRIRSSNRRTASGSVTGSRLSSGVT